VLSRLLGGTISLQCILRSEMVAAHIQSTSIESPNPLPAQPAEAPTADEEERALIRIRAAMNIFDAEEIREPEAADRTVLPTES
jgi:hypothetical protein